jgi:septal ring factor EnvC (AmiA/AmiB activator)
MELNLINQIGSRLDEKYRSHIGKLEERVSYIERQLNDLQVSYSKIQHSFDDLRKYMNTAVERIEGQYTSILNAIQVRIRAKNPLKQDPE